MKGTLFSSLSPVYIQPFGFGSSLQLYSSEELTKMLTVHACTRYVYLLIYALPYTVKTRG